MSSALESPLPLMSAVPAVGAVPMAASALPALQAAIAAGYVPARQLTGKVLGIWGKALIRTADGTIAELKVGDVVKKGDVVLTSQDGIVQIEADRSPTTAEIDQVIEQVAQGNPEVAPLAGLVGGDGSLQPGLRVDRVAEAVGGAGFDGGALAGAAAGLLAQALPPEDGLPVGTDSGPSPLPDSVTTAEDTPITFDPRGNDGAGTLTIVSVAGQPIAVGSPVQLPQGLVTLNADGTLTFTPNANFNGTLTFTYGVSDGTNPPVTALITIDVTPVNDAPVGGTVEDEDGNPIADPNVDPATGNYVASTPEDTPVSGVVRATDVDGDTLTFSAGTPPSNGTVVINPDGSWTYTPDPNYNGPDSFTVLIDDGNGGVTTAVVQIGVTPVNDAPVIGTVDDDDGNPIPDPNLDPATGNYTATTPEDTPVSGIVRATDEDGDPLTFSKGSDPEHGTVTVNPDGTWTYTPDPDYNGPDSFTVTVTDPSGATSTATVVIGVTPLSDTPAVAADSATTPEDTPVVIDVLANDSDADSTTLTITAINGQPIAVGSPVDLIDENNAPLGTVSLNADGTLTFSPAPGVNGPVEFTYTATDGQTPVTAGVTVDVTPVNDPPSAQADRVTTDEETAVTIAVRANDTDPDGDALTVTAVTQPSNGTVTIDPVTGNPVYTPNEGFNGSDTFTYTVRDPSGATSTATVTVSVGSVNDAPVAVDDTGTTSEDVALVVNASNGVLNGPGADSDPDGDTLAVTQVAFGPNTAGPGQVIAGAFGFLTLNADGSYTYRPNDAAQALDDGESGVDVFTYTVTDPAGATTTATLTLTVTGVNDGPLAIDDSATTPEDTPVTLAVLDNDTDPDSEPLTITAIAGTPVSPGDSVAVTGPNGEPAGTVTLNPDGTLTFEPEPGYNGPVDFEYTVSDGTTEDVGAVSLVVDSVNDTPNAQVDTVRGPEDRALTFDPRANDTDPDGDPLTITQINGQPIAVGTPVTLPEGVLELNDDGSLTFTPNPDFNGELSFDYTVSDGRGGTASSTVNVIIDPVNDAPVAEDDTVSTPEGVPVSGAIDATDPDGDPLTFTAGDPPTNGTLLLNPDGTWTYTPNPGYNGPDSFTVVVTDPDGATTTATITIGVTPVSESPSVADDSATTPEGTAVTLDVLANDADPDGDPLTITEVDGQPIAVGSPVTLLDENKSPLGTVALNPDGTLTFTPAEGVNGPVAFTYTVTDGTTPVTGNVTVDVTPVNDPPTAGDDAVTTSENTAVVIDVRANDTDPEGEPLTVTAVTQPANGVVTIDPATGNPVYTPTSGFTGTDSFTYTVTDADGLTSTATVTITVGGVNDAPVAVDDTGTTSEDVALVVNAANGVLNGPGADSDPDGDTLAVTQVAFGPNTAGPGQVIAGAFGFLTLNADGSYTYRPNDAAQALDDGESATDVFTYTVKDPSGASTTATLTLTVTGVNDGPVAVDDSATTGPDTPVTLAVLDNDTDPEGEPLTITAIAGTPVSPGDSVAVTGPNGEPAGTVTLNPDGTLTFEPEPGYSGPVDFEYTVSDGTTEDVGAVKIVVDSNTTNDPPVANDDSLVTDEDTPVSFDPRADDTDIDGGPLTITQINGRPIAVGTPVELDEGTVSLNDDGTLTFTPNPDFNGPVSFEYTVDDGNGGTDTATVDITVNPVNDAPVAEDDTVSTPEGVPVSGAIDATDPDGDPLTFTAGDPPTNGTLLLNPDGTWTYTPNPGYNGPDSFTVVVTDPDGATTTATITIGVSPVSESPSVADDSATTPEGTAVTLDVLANDADPDGDPLTITEVDGQPIAVGSPVTLLDENKSPLGTVALNPDGTLTFTPAEGVNGPVEFTYTVTDGTTPVTGNVTVDVTPVNDPPTAGDDAVTTSENTAVVIDVRANDTDPEGEPLTVTAFTQPANGVVTIDPVTGNPVYTPTSGFTGTDTFTYTVTDADGLTSTATVTITVGGVNDAPVAVDDTGTTSEDVALVVNAANGVLNGPGADSDPDGDTLAVTQVAFGPNTAGPGQVIAGAFGFLTLNADGSYTYRPNDAAQALDDGESATDVFTYTVKDPSGASTTATLTLTVTGVNDGPVAVDDSATTGPDTPVTLAVLDNDTDPDSEPLIITAIAGTPVSPGDSVAVTGPSGEPAGTVTLNPDGTLTFEPEPGYSGPVDFEYTVSDGTTEDVGAVKIVVDSNTTNDPPVANDDSLVTDEDTPVSFDPRADDTDIDGGPLTITQINGRPIAVGTPVELDEGTVSLNDDGTLTFTPNPDFNGPVSFEYTVDDGNGGTDTATVDITVNPVNDAPVAEDDTVSTPEGVPVSGAIDATDPDGDPLTFTAGDPPTNGTLLLNPDGTWTYTPNPGYNGPDSFTVVVTDPDGETTTATITIGVTPVSESPSVADDSATTPEGTAVTLDVLANDADPDGDPLTITEVDGQPIAVGSPVTLLDENKSPLGTVALNPDGTLTFTPAEGVNGPVEFTYTVTDGTTPVTGNVTVDVTPVNDPPTAGDDAVTTSENTAVVIDVRANDTDPEGEPLTVTAFTQPANGLVTLDPATGNPVYTPVDGFTGTDTFTYTVTDPDGLTSTATVTITVGGVNDAPVAVDDTGSTSEDVALVVNAADGVLNGPGADSDPDGDTLAVTQVAFGPNTAGPGQVIAGAFGFLTLNADGSYTYRPNDAAQALDDGESATDVFTYTVKDPSGASTTATLTLTVTGVNDGPVAVDDSATTGPDTPVTLAVLDNDTDPDSEPLTITAIAGTPVSPGDSVAVTGPSGEPAGTVTLNPDGTLTFEPEPGYSGPVDFEYTVSDGTTEDVGAVKIVVDSNTTNDPPVANDDSLVTDEDTPVSFDPRADDTDIDGGPLTITQINGRPIAVGTPVELDEGTVSLNDDGTLTFTPNPDFNGPVSFEYTVDDGNGGTDTATVDITVNPVNDAPVAVDDVQSVPEDTVATGNVLDNDGDVEDDPLVVTGFSVDTDNDGTPETFRPGETAVIAGIGEITLEADGSYTFTPDADFNGPVPDVTYTVSDGEGGTDEGTLKLEVGSRPDASITLDPNITPDDILNAAEAGGDVIVTGRVGADVKVGDTVTLTVNGQAFTGLVLAGGTFAIAVSGAALAADPDRTIDASVTTVDAEGNSVTATDTETYGVDITPPVASITLDANITPDDIVNAAEAGDTVAVTGRVGGDVKVGDTVTLTINGETFTGVVRADRTFSIDVAGAALAADPDRTIDASVTTTDAAGNSATATDTEGYGVDTTPPAASITLDANITPDDIVNAAEAGGTVAVTGTVGGDVKVGDTVTLTINGETYTGLVRADRSFSIDVPGAALAADADRTIDASVTTTDDAGNSTTATDTEGYGVDVTPPVASITLDANITADDIISAAEAGQTIPVTGIVGGDVRVGDTVTLTINGETYTGLVRADRTFSIDVPGAALAADPDRTIDASVTTTDAAGNSATATDTEGYLVDGAPTLDLDGSTPGTGYDTRFNENGAAVALADLDLAIADPDSTTLQSATVTLTNPQPGDVLVVGALPPGISATISGSTVTLTGAASADAYEAALRAISFDNTTSDPSTTPRIVEITVNDGLQDSNTAVATVSINTVEPQDDPSGEPYSFALGNYASNDLWTDLDSKGLAVQIDAFNADGSAGSIFVFDTTVPITDNSLGVDGTTRTNPTGVPGQIEHDRITGLSESIVVNLNGLANTATFDVASMNPTEDGGEVGRWVAYYQGTVVATGEFRTTPPFSSQSFTIDTGTAVFDSIKFESRPTAGNNQILDGTDYYLAGLKVSGPASVNGPYTLAENETLTIGAGSPDNLLANDSDADGDSFSITGINGSGITSGQTVTLPSGALLTINADGSFSYNPNGAYDSLDAGQVATDTFTYTVTDAFGATDTATATVTIIGVDATNNGPVAENDAFTLAEDTPITLVPNQLTGNDDDPDADPLTIVSVQNAVNGTVALVNGNVVFTPAADYNGPASFTYTVSDGKGGTATARVDLTVEPRPDATISLAANVTDDDILSAAESNQTVLVTGTVGGDAKPGDTVTLTVNGKTFTTTVASDLTFSAPVPGADLAADRDRTVEASITTVDANGNAITATDTDTYTVNTGVPSARNGSATTSEDQPYVFRWSDFGVTDRDGGPTEAVVIDTLPADGRLQVFTGGIWVDVAAGASVSRSVVDSAGLRFVPDANESGDGSFGGTGAGDQRPDYARFNFAPTDGVNTGTTRSFTIDVAPVADTPVTSVIGSTTTLQPFELPASQGLSWDYYDELDRVDSSNASDTQKVEDAIERDGSPTLSKLVTNVYLNGTTPGMPSTEPGGESDKIYTDEDDASRFTGFVFLEAGNRYAFSGTRDDTMRIELGGTTVYDEGFNQFGRFTGDTYTPTVTGFYSLEVVYYNGDGPGGLDLNLSVNGGAAQSLSTSNYLLLKNTQSVEQAGIPLSTFNPVGGDGGGFYPLPGPDASDTLVPLEVSASLTDADGSETLSLLLSGLPAGFTVTDGVRSAVVGSTPLQLNGWDLDSLAVRATEDYTGTSRVTLTATATEPNGSTASSSQSFNLVYTGTEARVVPVSGTEPLDGGHGGKDRDYAEDSLIHWNFDDRGVWCPTDDSRDAHHDRDESDRHASRGDSLSLKDLLHDQGAIHGLETCTSSVADSSRTTAAGAGKDSGAAHDAGVQTTLALAGLSVDTQIASDLLRQQHKIDAT